MPCDIEGVSINSDHDSGNQPAMAACDAAIPQSILRMEINTNNLDRSEKRRSGTIIYNDDSDLVIISSDEE